MDGPRVRLASQFRRHHNLFHFFSLMSENAESFYRSKLNRRYKKISDLCSDLQSSHGIYYQNLIENSKRLFYYKMNATFSTVKNMLEKAPISVITRGNRRTGVNLCPRDKGLATLFPVVLREGASGVRLALRAAP